MAYKKEAILDILVRRREDLEKKITQEMADREQAHKSKLESRRRDLDEITSIAGRVLSLADDPDILDDDKRWQKEVEGLRWEKLGRDTWGSVDAKYERDIASITRALESVKRIHRLVESVTGDVVSVETVKSLQILSWVR